MGGYWGWLSLHVGAVSVSSALFWHRGFRALSNKPVARRSLLGVIPHLVDTLLILSAVRLTFLIQQFPLQQPWLTAKVFALVAYVVLGWVAIRSAQPQRIRVWAFGLAIICLAYIVHTAITHQVRPF